MRPLQRGSDNLGKHIELQVTDRGILRRQLVIRTGVLTKDRKGLFGGGIAELDVKTSLGQTVAELMHPLANSAPVN